ncbi:MAG: type IV pilus twitching motility protein PilT [Nitrospiraceae bacterium]|nr:MAG: type IV pilus twitching motility protein PilT [Nitrospiraceae bacterium]
MSRDIDALLKKAVTLKASDMHLKAGSPPVVRINGALDIIQDEPKMNVEDLQGIAAYVMNKAQMEQFLKNREFDMAYSIPGLGRFRCNAYHQRGSIGIVFRIIPPEILELEDLMMPVVIKKISLEPRGLILVTGTTGSGKTTTLASMIDYINTNRAVNIITIEDPIEFLHRDKKSIVSQREIGMDATTFAKALRAALRQDPDVILVGEMRDFETIKTALDAAETGHLVVSTLHTTDTVETINRIISVFPPYQHGQVRAQLASVLKAIISMRLIPRADGRGRVPAVEILINTATIRSCIEEPDKTKNVHDYLAEGVSQYGMQTFDQSLMSLYKNELITYEEAVNIATNPDDFVLKVKGVESTKDIWGAGGDISGSKSKKVPGIDRFSS